MVYLIMAILCSACITLILKIGSKYSQNRYAMLTCNYITCIVLVGIFMPKDISFDLNASGSRVLLLGLVNGALFLVCMAYNQINVVKNGAILTATFVRLGVMIPTLLSIFLFKEIPTLIQIVGIALVIIAFIVMGMKKQENLQSAVKISLKDLILLMILGGITDSMSKVFEQMCSMEYADWFLFITFLIALFLCLIITIIAKQKLEWKDCLVGIAIGVPNYLSTLFLLLSLGEIPAFFAYPTYSVGTILVVMSVTYIAFKEKLNRNQKLGIGLIILSLILLNC